MQFLFTNLKNLYRVVYAIESRLKSFRFPDLPISFGRNSWDGRSERECEDTHNDHNHKYTLDYNYN